MILLLTAALAGLVSAAPILQDGELLQITADDETSAKTALQSAITNANTFWNPKGFQVEAIFKLSAAQANPTCDTAPFTQAECGSGFSINNDLSNTCAGATCMKSDCCTAIPTCATANGDSSPFTEAQCGSGYTLKPDLSNTCAGTACLASDCCIDIDECATNNGGCPYACQNMPGSWVCTYDTAATTPFQVNAVGPFNFFKFELREKLKPKQGGMLFKAVYFQLEDGTWVQGEKQATPGDTTLKQWDTDDDASDANGKTYPESPSKTCGGWKGFGFEDSSAGNAFIMKIQSQTQKIIGLKMRLGSGKDIASYSQEAWLLQGINAASIADQGSGQNADAWTMIGHILPTALGMSTDAGTQCGFIYVALPAKYEELNSVHKSVKPGGDSWSCPNGDGDATPYRTVNMNSYNDFRGNGVGGVNQHKDHITAQNKGVTGLGCGDICAQYETCIGFSFASLTECDIYMNDKNLDGTSNTDLTRSTRGDKPWKTLDTNNDNRDKPTVAVDKLTNDKELELGGAVVKQMQPVWGDASTYFEAQTCYRKVHASV